MAAWLASWSALEMYARLRPTPGGRFDAVIVAGSRLQSDGTPSVAFQQRVKRGVGEWKAGRAPLLVMTGGPSRHGHSIGAAGAALARALGALPDALAVEERSTSTDENAAYARLLLDPQVQRVLVVSDTYHGFRCRRVFQRRFREVELSLTRPPVWEGAVMGLREVAAVVWYAARGRL